MFTPENLRVSGHAPDKGRKWPLLSLLVMVLTSILIFGLAGNQSDAQAAGFTDKRIQGDWGFSAAGTILPPALPAATPAAAVGIMAFDGMGGCSITDTINIGGTSASRTSTTCTYSVNPDGSGSLSALFPGDPGPTPLSFVMVDNAKEIRFIRTDLGVASGVARRQ
jgi:hypothetical protein